MKILILILLWLLAMAGPALVVWAYFDGRKAMRKERERISYE